MEKLFLKSLLSLKFLPLKLVITQHEACHRPSQATTFNSNNFNWISKQDMSRVCKQDVFNITTFLHFLNIYNLISLHRLFTRQLIKQKMFSIEILACIFEILIILKCTNTARTTLHNSTNTYVTRQSCTSNVLPFIVIKNIPGLKRHWKLKGIKRQSMAGDETIFLAINKHTTSSNT